MPTSSKSLNYHSFINTFKKDKVSQFYFVYGNEEYLKKQVIDKIIDRVIPPEYREFDLSFLYGDDCSISDVLNELSTKPFLAKDRVVILRKFDNMRTANQQKIIDFLSRNEFFNFVILSSDSLDNRLKIAKQINKLGIVIHCRSPYKAEDMLPWLNNEVRLHNKTIGRDAAMLFVNRVELDYMTASSELEKLLIYTIDKENITIADVQFCTGYSKTYSVFDLIDSVGKKDKKQTFIIAENLIENKEAAVFLITMLLRFYIQLWKINYLKKEGISAADIEKKHLTDVYSLFRRHYLSYAENYSLSTFSAIFSILLEADTELKSIKIEESLIIERMLFRIYAIR